MSILLGILTAVVLAAVILAGILSLPFAVGFLLARLVQALVPLYVLAWFVLHGRRCGKGWERLEGVRYAHRGLHGGPAAPENSLAAFDRAVQRGYGAELDVHLTADGRLAVIHDADLFRLCGRHGMVEEMTAAELSQVRLEGTEQAIPFLEEVLALFQGKAPLVVELKSAGGNHAALAEKTMECLDRFPIDYCVESFDPRVLAWLRRKRPEVLRGQLTQNFLKRPEGLSLWNRLALTNLFYNFAARPDFVACRFDDRNLPAVRLCRWMGVRSACWTIRTPEELRTAERERSLPIFECFDPKEEVC